jgi:2-C-methyl-D-erythritol 2,4-cyclodiphosphate synthase
MFRIGHGYDAHRLVCHRPLILGGLTIPYPLGLDGHSDADVLCHALTDALLGALALGTIGDHFPDTDPQYKNANSLELLKKVYHMIQSKGFHIENIDSVVVAQAPKLKPFIPDIRLILAEALQLSVEHLSIKATTTERMGFEGREEGISAHAIVLLCKP